VAVGRLTKQGSAGLDELIEKFDNNDISEDAINKFLDRVKANLEKFGFDASGNMFQSLKALPSTRTGKRITSVNIQAEDYWEDLEKGTKPKGYTKANRKKLQPRILEWINTKESLLSIAGDEKSKKSLSYAIATNILKNGTIKRFGYKGKPFLTMEIPKLKGDIIKDYE
jgi:hypothetical protein